MHSITFNKSGRTSQPLTVYLLVQSEIGRKKRGTLLKHCLKSLSGEPDVPRKWNRKEALEIRGHHYWSVTGVLMECYVRLAAYDTQQDGSRRDITESRSASYCYDTVLVSVSAICPLSD